MNLHTKLIGAIDAVILTLTAVVMFALLFALMSPDIDRPAIVDAQASAQAQDA